MIQIKSARELDQMREAGRHVGEILLRLCELACPGVSTLDLDRAAAGELDARKLGSSFLGYAPGGAATYLGGPSDGSSDEAWAPFDETPAVAASSLGGACRKCGRLRRAGSEREGE